MELEAPNSDDGSFAGQAKICGSCGAKFGCGAEAISCWCSAVELDPSAAVLIGRSFGDCLCVRCLVKYNEESAQKSI
ncbi:MAG: cysteine-rich CWC family protein [Pyrinomonadaceae bacterium]|nr:cysteine-rich CWC family protein [Pyrinomonadaceae bacterium]